MKKILPDQIAVCDHICKRSILQTTRGHFIKFTVRVPLGTKMNWLDLRSKVKLMRRPDMVKNH